MNCCSDASAPSKDSNILQCSVCSGKYHYECLNLSSLQFTALNKEYKACWKCPACINVTRRVRSNLNTPVRSYTELPADDQSMDMSCEILDHSSLSSSASLGNTTITTDNPLKSSTSADFESFTATLLSTLNQWRCDMNRDIHQLRDDIKSALTDIKKEMHNLRAEQSLIKQQVSDIRGDVVVLQTSAQSQSVEHDILKKRVDELSCAHVPAVSESMLNNLEAKIDVLEQQARQCNVEICNLPERRNENLPAIVEAIGSAIKSPILLKDIVSVHRVPHAHQQSTRPKNIVLKFTTRILRDNMLSAFRKVNSLKTDQIGITGTSASVYVNEHLTLRRKQLFRRTREVANNQNYKFVWIRNGTILVREREGDNAFVIRGESDLNKITKIKTNPA